MVTGSMGPRGTGTVGRCWTGLDKSFQLGVKGGKARKLKLLKRICIHFEVEGRLDGLDREVIGRIDEFARRWKDLFSWLVVEVTVGGEEALKFLV